MIGNSHANEILEAQTVRLLVESNLRSSFKEALSLFIVKIVFCLFLPVKQINFI